VNRYGFSGKHRVMEEHELDDGALFERSVAEPELFTLVFDRHYRAVYGYLSRRVGRTVADDLTAETFIRAFERRAAYDAAAGRALPWLLGIALNLLAHHRRSEARQLRAFAASRAREPSRSADDEGAWVDADTRQRLVAALEQLDDYDREALLLYAWGELRYQEIAEVLRIPVGTVRSRLNRARRKLRQALEPDDETENVVQMRREGVQGA
jgi:RNA polymerase sigma factor (sigma-70 family)